MSVAEKFLTNITAYALTDYRRFLSAHLLFLSSLCQLSIRSVSYFVNQFLSSTLVTNQLLPVSSFEELVNTSLSQSQVNAPTTLVRSLFMLRTTSHANAIISTYGTNFDYVPSRNDHFEYNMHGRAMLYAESCSCGLNMSCSMPASLIVNDFTRRVPIDGLKMGCTPSESFLASTLECFYNASCINLLLKTDRNGPSPLDRRSSRFPPTALVSDLVADLFVESWSINISYLSYYSRCMPLSCSYSYYQQLDSLYTVTYVLGLYGGLNILFKWICPRLVYLSVKLFHWYKARKTTVIPTTV